MKKKIIVAILAVFSVFYLLSTIQQAPKESSAVASPKNVEDPVLGPASKHVQYFGFAITDCLFDDPTTNTTETSYFDEVAQFSNISHLCAFEPFQDLTSQFEQYKQARVQALLHIEHLLFTYKVAKDEPSGQILVLRPDYKERLREFVANNDLDTYQDQIAALYIADEPFWNSLEYEVLEEVSIFVNQELPEYLQFLVLAYPSVSQARSPSTVQWVGYDQYGIWDPQNDPRYTKDIDMLVGKLSSEQKIFIIFESQYNPQYKKYGLERSGVGTMLESYYQLANSEEKIIGMVGYVWPNGFDAKEIIGARGLGEFHGLFQSMFDQITGSN